MKWLGEMAFTAFRRIGRALCRGFKDEEPRGHDSLTAANPRHNDIYIVEFPKSGVTWLSTLLANMALIESGRKEIVAFPSSGLYIPDVHICRYIGDVAYASPPVRMIKSHSEYNPNYAFIIYLVRNPVDVMKSYYRFAGETSPELLASIGSFDSFCRSEKYGAPAWRRHIRSWLKRQVLTGNKLHLCRYEDLVTDAAHELEKISQGYGWQVCASSIAGAVDRSTMQKMKESEAFHRSVNPCHTITFVGGKDGTVMAEETREYVRETCAEEMQFLGYC